MPESNAEIQPLRVGMVGVGGFGAARRSGMRQTGLFQIVAAYDINEEALADARRQDGATPVSSYAELLDRDDLEAMVISTGAKFHAEQALAAMERGLHVFVEKPLCSTPAELKALIHKQRETGLKVGVGHHDHNNDAVAVTIKNLIDRGELGRVASFDAMTAHTGGLFIQPGDWRGDPQRNPGGMLFQCGVHKIHELMFYFGAIVRVCARMRHDVHTTGTADTALCHLEFASGLIGCLNAYHVVPYCHRLNIFGTKANLYRDDRFFDEGTSLKIQHDNRADAGAKQPLADVPFEKASGSDDPLRNFYLAVREGAEPSPSLLDGARAVAVVFAAEKSAATGKVSDVELYDEAAAKAAGPGPCETGTDKPADRAMPED